MDAAMDDKENQLAEIKNKLKRWEYYFTKCHQRKPAKADIDGSPDDIKASYIAYSKLKNKGSTSEVTKVDSSRKEVWGEHVSVKALERMKTRVEFTANGDLQTVELADVPTEDSVKKGAWADRFTQRLVSQSTKLGSAKLSPFRPNKREPELASEEVPADATSRLPPRRFIGKRTRSRTIPKGWKEHVQGTEAPNNDIQDTQAEGECLERLTSAPASAKEPKDIVLSAMSRPPTMTIGGTYAANVSSRNDSIPQTSNSIPKTSNSIPQTSNSIPKTSNSIPQTSTSIPQTSTSIPKTSTSMPTTSCRSPAMSVSSNSAMRNVTSSPIGQSLYSPNIAPRCPLPEAAAAFVSSKVATRSTHEIKDPKSCFSQQNQHTADPFQFDDDGNSPIKQRRRASRAKAQPSAESDQSNKTPERKSTTKKRKATTGTCIGQLSPHKPAKKAKTTPSVRSIRNVDANFVKLNLRKKVYARGKTGLKGAAYKRQQWKNKMSAKRGTACFKCGEEGHWANKCTQVAKSVQEEVFNEDVDGFLVDKPAEEYLDDMMLGAYTGAEETTVSRLPTESSCEPLFDDCINQSECRQRISQTLVKVFGFKAFRHGQIETVERLLRGKSTLVMLSTGAGKSLCYQLAAYMYAKRAPAVAVVISPLVSLMEDQVVDLPKDVKGVCLHTNQTDATRAKFMSAVIEGQVQFLLCSPEFLCSTSSANIEFFTKIPPISFACIDEAHCLSQWSHNFRPSYLRVCKILRVRFGVRCFLGLTATATQETVSQIASYLDLKDPSEDCVKGTLLPPNLNLSVSKDPFKEQALLDLLQSGRFKGCQSIIIYCTRREQTDRLASTIRTVIPEEEKAAVRVPVAESYHAGLSAAQRRRVQKLFMNGKLRIVVATVAFGMGLDKSDVRAVIHYNLPKGFESYVQEIGRAGRDGLPAECHVFLEPEGTDVAELEKHTYADSIDQSSIRKLLSMIYQLCKCEMLADTVRKVEQVSASDTVEQVAAGDTVEQVSACAGHERPIVIESAVSLLNITEQGIATLLFYLELHNPKWLENMSSIYSSCTIKCYSGLSDLHSAAKKCIPLGVALALYKKQSGKSAGREFTFNILEVSNLLNKPSGYIKKELRQLQWTQTAEGKYKRTGLMVEFGELAMRVKAPGNLSEEELDDALRFLKSRVVSQEKRELVRLNYFYHVLSKLAYKDYFMVSEEADKSRSDSLKQAIVHYFEHEEPTKEYVLPNKSVDSGVESFITSQVTSFISTYSHEHDFSGRDIAKILYGIASPNFPPSVWGRVRRFWRSLLGHDFNLIVRIATEHLIRTSRY